MKRILIVVVVFAIAGAIGTRLWYSNALKPTKASEATVAVGEGEGTTAIAKQLHDKKLIKSKKAFSWHVKFNHLAKDIKSGRFVISGQKSSPEIAKQLTEVSKGASQFTLKEGVTQREIADQLDQLDIVKKGEFSSLKAKDFAKYDFLQGAPPNATLEGFLFPETYTIPPAGSDAEAVATIMLNQFGKELTPELRSQIQRSGHTVYETVIVASLVEEEVRSDQDRRLVAGIIYKRLAQGIRLDIDATVRYAVNKKSGTPLSSADLGSNSPYNTRKNKGLPPGPIANPGLSSIKAAINPEESEYLFYLSAPNGQTIFAKTNEEHEANVQRYLNLKQ